MTLTLAHAHGVLTWTSADTDAVAEMGRLLDNWRRWSTGLNSSQFVFINHDHGAAKIWYRDIHSIDITD